MHNISKKTIKPRYFLALLILLSNVLHVTQALSIDPFNLGLGAVAGIISVMGGRYAWNASNYSNAEKTLDETKRVIAEMKHRYSNEIKYLQQFKSDKLPAEKIKILTTFIASSAENYINQVTNDCDTLEKLQQNAQVKFKCFAGSDKHNVAEAIYNDLVEYSQSLKNLRSIIDSDPSFFKLCVVKQSFDLKYKGLLPEQAHERSIDQAIRVRYAKETYPYLTAYKSLASDRDILHEAMREYKKGAIFHGAQSPISELIYGEVASLCENIEKEHAAVVTSSEFQKEKEQSQCFERLAQIAVAKEKKNRIKQDLVDATKKKAAEEKRANDLKFDQLIEEQKVNAYNAEEARQNRIFDPERHRLRAAIADEQRNNATLKQEREALSKENADEKRKNNALSQELNALQGIKANLEYKLQEQAHLHQINAAIAVSDKKLFDLYEKLETYEYNFAQRCKDPALRAWNDAQISELKSALGIETCTICTDTISNDLFVTSCNHKFHKTCLHQCKNVQGVRFVCPNCKSQVKNSNAL